MLLLLTHKTYVQMMSQYLISSSAKGRSVGVSDRSAVSLNRSVEIGREQRSNTEVIVKLQVVKSSYKNYSHA